MWNTVTAIVQVRIEEITDGSYRCRYFNTYDKHKDVTKRAYLPCWITSKHVEYFSHTRSYRTDKPFNERFEINEFICWPFALSNSGRIPAEIIEKLQIDGFCSVVLTYDQPPLCSMVQLAWSSFLSISIWPFCLAELKSEGRVWRPSHCTIFTLPPTSYF